MACPRFYPNRNAIAKASLWELRSFCKKVGKKVSWSKSEMRKTLLDHTFED